MRRLFLLLIVMTACRSSREVVPDGPEEGTGTAANGDESGASASNVGSGNDASPGNPDASPGSVPEAGPPPPPPPPQKVDVTNETVTAMGFTRDYVLAVPKSYSAAKSYPLVLVFHGDGGDGPSMRSYVKFDDATGEDAVVAYP